MAEIRRLEDAVNLLWGWMPAEQVREIREDVPGLAEFCARIHDKVDHEEAMVRRTSWDPSHPEAFCGRCGRLNPSWVVHSDRYNTAVNRSEIVCPSCFMLAHEAATGMTCTWSLVPATPFRWVDDGGRSTPFIDGGTNG